MNGFARRAYICGFADRREVLTDMDNINNAVLSYILKNSEFLDISDIINILNSDHTDQGKLSLLQALADGEIDRQLRLSSSYFEGVAAGKAKIKAKAKTEMTKRLIDENLPVELIVKVSGFTVSEVEQLRA